MNTTSFSHKTYASSADLEKLANLGDEFTLNGNTYKFVQVHTACTGLAANVITAGEVLYQTATAHVVTNDRSEGISDSADHYCGLAPSDLSSTIPESTATTTYYMWMQIKGFHTAVVTNGDDDITAGVEIIASGDGTCDSAAAGTDVKPNYIGTAMAADVDAANTVSVWMRSYK